jgi:predicted DNA-binding transcriptional regulator AlpA
MTDTEVENHPKRLMRIKQLAAFTGVTPQYIYREVKADRYPPPIKLPGGGTRWPLEDALAWQNKLERGVTTDRTAGARTERKKSRKAA